MPVRPRTSRSLDRHLLRQATGCGIRRITRRSIGLLTIHATRRSDIKTLRRAGSIGSTREVFGITSSSSLVYRFELLIDYFAGEPINRDVQPVSLLSFNKKIGKICGIGRITARLRDYIDHQIPSPCLIYFA
jgi:hypothetical protein